MNWNALILIVIIICFTFIATNNHRIKNKNLENRIQKLEKEVNLLNNHFHNKKR